MAGAGRHAPAGPRMTPAAARGLPVRCGRRSGGGSPGAGPFPWRFQARKVPQESLPPARALAGRTRRHDHVRGPGRPCTHPHPHPHPTPPHPTPPPWACARAGPPRVIGCLEAPPVPAGRVAPACCPRLRHGRAESQSAASPRAACCGAGQMRPRRTDGMQDICRARRQARRGQISQGRCGTDIRIGTPQPRPPFPPRSAARGTEGCVVRRPGP